MKENNNLKKQMINLFGKSFSITSGIIFGIVGASVLAVTVGTLTTWNTGENLTAADLTNNFNTINTAIEGIPGWQKGTTTTDAVYMDGNVGIGTTGPNGKLDVNGALVLPGSSTNAMTRPAVGTAKVTGEISGYGSSILSDDGFLRLSAGGGTASGSKSFIDLSGYSMEADMFQNIILGTSGQERLRITNIGNVGIGTATPGVKFQVGNAADGTTAEANAWNLLSDLSVKKNLKKIDEPMEKISKLSGYFFHWKIGKDKRRQVGIIAQQVEKVLPEIVSTNGKGLKSVDYSKLAPLLIESIKELKSQNDALKRRISALEAKIK